MKIAHLDLFSGISGDMTLGALLDAGLPLRDLKRALSALPLTGYSLRVHSVMKGAIAATRFEVRVSDHGHHHTPLRAILKLLRKSRLPTPVREAAERVFVALGRAEGKIHAVDPMDVEFHEVGSVDSIVDIVGVCAGLHLLEVERVTCGPVPVGRGEIRGDHGSIPSPGPATMELLRGFPIASIDSDCELVTPTGAAILSALARPGGFPQMRLDAVGTGAGTADFARPNVLRVFLGSAAPAEESDLVWEIRTNLDNVSGELVGYVSEKLFAAGALDVWTESIQMKKSRPGVGLAVLVPPDRRESVESILMEQTPTLGLRRVLMERTKLDRREERVATPWGNVRIKIGLRAGRPIKRAPEYEDVKAIADRHGVPFARVWEASIFASECPKAQNR